MAGDNTIDSTSEFEVRPYDQVDAGTSSGTQRVGLDFSSTVSRKLTRTATIDDEENAHVSPHFPYPLIMKVVSSEPRDVLQSERTFLTFTRFATALFFTALGIILNFKFDTSGDATKSPDEEDQKHRFNHTKFSVAVSYILLVLSLFVLVVSGSSYYITINRYAQHKIATYNFNNLPTAACITGVIITLIVINVTLIVEGFLETK
ncbi:hypothetical protein CORT_0D04770 [Candida orthopsilosis Co 90-125]|uniref:DUF202 domain-containing protein n=1 Tax=Candida orthopsilosis (strain 90-125) TaxID=1136231 RepID=H8X669_CANO9|nr:hypothetical protein CORT_0D04770 [Candida orthopsilosis Co 90-125]CCG23317.1 hypothetical protein CORT_0D04770 [Candida orthopsilosis Co 90-125]